MFTNESLFTIQRLLPISRFHCTSENQAINNRNNHEFNFALNLVNDRKIIFKPIRHDCHFTINQRRELY